MRYLIYILNTIRISIIGKLLGYQYLIETMYKYTCLYKIIPFKAYFKSYICHSDFPSLLAYSDFLSEYGIKHTVDY